MAERVVKVKLSAEVAEYANAMQLATEKTRSLGEEGDKATQKSESWQKLGTLALGVGTAMTALTFAVAKTGIEYNTLQQTSRAALTTLLGGAQAANEQMDKLDAFARTSPFSKATFITAQQQMLAFGVETKKVIPYLDAIQDAVAAAGGGNQELSEISFIMAQISSAGKITGQDLLQFGQRGVNAAELIGSQMGKTGAEIRQEITAGTLGADEALDALAAGMKTKFNGAAENVKETFSGAMDRVQAAWRDLSADLMKPLVDPNGGGALVDFLNWTADLMRSFQALPEPVKLTGGAMFAFAGFVTLASGAIIKLTPKAIEMWQAFQNLSGAMRGIGIAGGIAMIALVAIVAIVGAVAAAQAEARQKAEAYADTLEEGSNRITKATREMARENLSARSSFLWWEDSSVLEKADELGISLGTVQDAVTGNVSAMKELKKAQEEYNQAVIVDRNKGDFNQDDDDRLKKINAIISAVQGESSSLDEAIQMAELKQKADAESANTSESVADAYLTEVDAVAELTSQLTDLISKINEANGIGQDAVTTNARWLSALEGVSIEVQKQRDAYEEANGTLDGFALSLDQSTSSGSANASMLADVASKAQSAAEAQFAQDQATMSADEAVTKYTGTLATQRQAFIDAATAAGFNADEVNGLANEIFNLPDSKTVKVLADTAQAQNSLLNLINSFNALPEFKNIKVQTTVVGAGTVLKDGFANGGIVKGGVKAFAGGGFEPGIYPYTPGGIHKMAEEYTEAYISLDPARRQRSEAVWVRTGQEMGMFSQQQSSASSVSLDGMSISGTLDLGNGLTGFIDGRIQQRATQLSSDIRSRRRSDA